MASRKSWDDLSPKYRARLERGGITRSTFATADKSAARGHKATPEHPQEAILKPHKYERYVQDRSDEMRQVIARKERIWGHRPKYKRGRSARAVTEPNPVTKKLPTIQAMRAFLRMSDDDIAELDWRDDEWWFLFYH